MTRLMMKTTKKIKIKITRQIKKIRQIKIMMTRLMMKRTRKIKIKITRKIKKTEKDNDDKKDKDKDDQTEKVRKTGKQKTKYQINVKKTRHMTWQIK